jgi:putative membrane protein
MWELLSRWRQSLRLFFTGFTMGSADIVPGVSGGTIAFIFGIYEELLYSIKLVSGQVPRLLLQGKIKEAIGVVPFPFLLPLGAGLAAAIITLTSVISYLLQTYPVFIWSFFFGLVLASVVIVSRRIVTWDLHDMVAATVAAAAAYLIVGAVPVETPATLPAFFISGAIAICAMILPGISGSFLLIIMGKYEQIVNAVTQRDFIILGTVILGAVLGLALFSRLLSWLFRRHHDVVVAVLTGFMVGSLRKIWPWKETLTTRINSKGIEVPLQEANILPTAFDQSVMIALLLCALGIVLILLLERFKVTDEKVIDVEDRKFAREHRQALKSQEHD